MDQPERAAPKPGPTIRGEIRALTGLRIVAALWVLLFHYRSTLSELLGETLTPIRPVLAAGGLGVDLFFVLSGFVIAHTYLDSLGPRLRLGAALRFGWARISRIWPVYLLVTHLFGLWLLARLIFGTDGNISFQVVQPRLDPWSWLQQVLGVQLWSRPYLDGSSWVGPAWSTSAEWLAYVLFPVTVLLAFRARRLPRWVLAGVAVGLMVPLAWICLTTGRLYFPFSWTLRILAGFTSGVFVHLAVRGLVRTRWVGRWASWLALLTVVAIPVGILAAAPLGRGERCGAVLVLFPVLVGSLALAEGGVARVLALPWMCHGGRISFSFYLVHIPILEIFWVVRMHVPPLTPGTPLGLAAVAVVPLVILVASHLLYSRVEEPARLRMRSWIPRPTPPADAPVIPPAIGPRVVETSAAAARPLPSPLPVDPRSTR